VRNVHTPLYEDDYVEKTIAAAGIAEVGAEIVNVGRAEAVTTQEYCEMAGEILGKEPKFVENSKAWPIWADTTKMVEMLGPNKVSVREGVRRFCQENDRDVARCRNHAPNRPNIRRPHPHWVVRIFITEIKRLLVEADAVSHALELGDEAVAAAGVVVGSSDEPVGAEVGVGGVVVQQMPGDHQDGVPDCQGG
jgi:hypothetical protein